MIELGSGAGLVAAAIANKLESPDDLLIATDLPEVINFALFPMSQSHTVRCANCYMPIYDPTLPLCLRFGPLLGVTSSTQAMSLPNF
jgi:hypothetical protein